MKERLAIQMQKKAKIVEKEPLTIYELNTSLIISDKKNNLAKFHIGLPNSLDPTEKVLMLVGATGAGKTTLINGIINYILGVEFEDDFRFKLISETTEKTQAHSQTDAITAYTINQMEGSRLPYTLTIIDTPGFGDTRGLERDKELNKQIEAFFSLKDGISHLDGIGFVTQASLPRLTPTQKYIFDAILSIFGKDIEENIFMMITFADGAEPPVVASLEEAEIPYNTFFEFNNSALFVKQKSGKRRSSFVKMFWDMGLESFDNFFTDFEKVESRSLQLTKDVLKERQKLEANILGLQPRINEGLAKLDELRQEEMILNKFKAEIESNKDFNYTVKRTVGVKVNTPTGVYTTTCLKCNHSCHYTCAIPNDKDKAGCAAMDNNGYCTVCANKCHWTSHSNTPFRYVNKTIIENKTSQELKQKYDKAIKGKTRVQSMIKGIENTLAETAEDVFQMIQQVHKSLHRLEEIALKPNPLTEVEYIEIMINSERQEKKEGWKQRVDYLEEAKKMAETLSNITTNKYDDINRILSKKANVLDNFKEWAKRKMRFWN